jgi:hypothetical protein
VPSSPHEHGEFGASCEIDVPGVASTARRQGDIIWTVRTIERKDGRGPRPNADTIDPGDDEAVPALSGTTVERKKELFRLGLGSGETAGASCGGANLLNRPWIVGCFISSIGTTEVKGYAQDCAHDMWYNR